MGRSAKSAAVSEQACPILAGAQISLSGEALSPQIFRPFFAMPIVGVAPQPRGQRLVLLAVRINSRHAPIDFGLRLKESVERRAGQFTRVPGVIGSDLRIADIGQRYR